MSPANHRRHILIMKKIVIHLQKGTAKKPSVLYLSEKDLLEFKEPELLIGDDIEKPGRTKLTNQANPDIHEVWEVQSIQKTRNSMNIKFKLVHRNLKENNE